HHDLACLTASPEVEGLLKRRTSSQALSRRQGGDEPDARHFQGRKVRWHLLPALKLPADLTEGFPQAFDGAGRPAGPGRHRLKAIERVERDLAGRGRGVVEEVE